jgi:predicted acyltransferase
MNDRLISLDAFRGFTILFMIIVNTPGSWSHVYAPLLHAEWNGATPTDYVFPFFLFIVGVSIVLAYHKKIQEDVAMEGAVKKILIRTLKIYIVGLFLWLFPNFDFGNIRWVGVLPRIAFVFLPCALLFLYTDWKLWLKLAIGILLSYWIIMVYIPIPGIGQADLSGPIKNWAHYLDSIALPGKKWQGTWDPEGILSTFPAIVTGIAGMLAGKLITVEKDTYKRLAYLMLSGFGLFVLGSVVDWFFPINKHIWSSSYVLHTAGLAYMTLGLFMYIIDVLGYQKWTAIGRIFGANAITAYVLSGVLTVIFYNNFGEFPGLNRAFVEGVGPILSFKMASLLYALLYAAIIFVPVNLLYRRKIFIKL